MRSLLCLMLLLLVSPALWAKTPRAIEQELVRAARRLSYWADYAAARAEAAHLDPADSLARANDELRRQLLYYTAAEPATLTYALAFAVLQQEHVTTTTSPDGCLRIYSWDTQQGGTMHFFDNVFQYQAGPGLARSLALPRSDNAAGGVYSEIFPVQKGPQTYYLGYSHAIHSSHTATSRSRYSPSRAAG